MKKFHGFSKHTAQKIMLDMGAVFVAFDINASYEDNKRAGKCVGGTQGGGGFTATPTRRNISVDGLPENVKGLDEFLYWIPTLNVKMLEQDADNLRNALAAAEIEDVLLNSVKYKRIAPRDHTEDSDYLTNVTYAGRIRGSDYPVYIVVENALNVGGLGWNFPDRQETVSDITFTGHYEISEDDTLSDPPFAIYIPDDVDPAAVRAAIEETA